MAIPDGMAISYLNQGIILFTDKNFLAVDDIEAIV